MAVDKLSVYPPYMPITCEGVDSYHNLALCDEVMGTRMQQGYDTTKAKHYDEKNRFPNVDSNTLTAVCQCVKKACDGSLSLSGTVVLLALEASLFINKILKQMCTIGTCKSYVRVLERNFFVKSIFR